MSYGRGFEGAAHQVTRKLDITFVLWGFNPAVPVYRAPIAITGGSLRHCRAEQRMRKDEGWTFGIYLEGTAPVGLRLQAENAVTR